MLGIYKVTSERVVRSISFIVAEDADDAKSLVSTDDNVVWVVEESTENLTAEAI